MEEIRPNQWINSLKTYPIIWRQFDGICGKEGSISVKWVGERNLAGVDKSGRCVTGLQCWIDRDARILTVKLVRFLGHSWIPVEMELCTNAPTGVYTGNQLTCWPMPLGSKMGKGVRRRFHTRTCHWWAGSGHTSWSKRYGSPRKRPSTQPDCARHGPNSGSPG